MALTQKERVRERALTAEAVREVGVLLVALAPLDLAFAELNTRTGAGALFFVLLGVYCFGQGLRMERGHG